MNRLFMIFFKPYPVRWRNTGNPVWELSARKNRRHKKFFGHPVIVIVAFYRHTNAFFSNGIGVARPQKAGTAVGYKLRNAPRPGMNPSYFAPSIITIPPGFDLKCLTISSSSPTVLFTEAITLETFVTLCIVASAPELT